MNTELQKCLTEIAGRDGVRLGEPMRDHTTFRIGGPADYFVRTAGLEKLVRVLECCRDFETPCFFLGKGSNLLVSDAGFRGVVLQLESAEDQIRREGSSLISGAGAGLADIAAASVRSGLTGFEFASGIPGTLGGAVTMNAGAYGGEMSHVLREATVIKCEGDRILPACLTRDELELGYRTSIIKRRGWIVVEAVLDLEEGEPSRIQARIDELTDQRASKQPLEYPSAGSTFKRPEGYFAGKLIMDAGLKGFSVGGAMVSQKHSGFVINHRDATAEDVRELIRRVQDIVWDRFGVRLEPEVLMLGFDD